MDRLELIVARQDDTVVLTERRSDQELLTQKYLKQHTEGTGISNAFRDVRRRIHEPIRRAVYVGQMRHLESQNGGLVHYQIQIPWSSQDTRMVLESRELPVWRHHAGS